MKRLFITLLALTAALNLFAQQEAMYTQHMYNKLAINPAYAGSRTHTSITALYRDQWTGFDGAPSTATLNIHGKLKNPKLALGFQVYNDQLGISNTTGLQATYAYRLPMGNGHLSFGISAGFNHYKVSLTEAISIDAGDPTLAENLNLLLPNVGGGIYYNTPTFYAGVSVPKLIQNELINTDLETSNDVMAQEIRHYNGMIGGVITLSETVKLRPTALVKYAPNAPVQADLSATFLFIERFWVGGTYRTQGSVDGHIEFQASRQLRIGYAYDYVINDLGSYTGGSHEILVGFDLNFLSKDRHVTPRQMTLNYF